MYPAIRVSRRSIALFFLVLFAFLPVSTLSAHAQTNAASVEGTVVDQTGAIIPGAAITVTDTATQQQRHTKADSAGIFSVPGLLPATYTIRVIQDGFEAVSLENVALHVSDRASFNVRLTVGHSDQIVTVDAGDLTINTTDASVSTVVDHQFVENLPLNGRSFQSLLYLSPGVTPNVTSANSLFSQGQFVVNGQRGDANYWLVDGVSGNIGIGLDLPGAGMSGAIGATNALGGTSALVSVDAMQEFRMETSSYGAEFGRQPGGQISIQTRSGTNRFHGTLFDYLRNGDLDATDWFADHNGLAKPLEIQNDFGGVLGGPIRKDRTFFFLSLEGLRLRQPTTFLGTVPDMASRSLAIPAMQPYINMYPLPKPGVVDAGPGFAPYSTTFSNPGFANAYSLRIDHQLLKNLNLFARYSHAPSRTAQRGLNQTTANVTTTETEITKTATIGATWAKSARIVDDLRFNYSVAGGVTNYTTDDFGGGTAFPGANLFPDGSSYRNSDVLFLLGIGTSMRSRQGFLDQFFQHQINLVNTLSVQQGSHALKFGGDYRRLTPSADVIRESLIPVFLSMDEVETGTTLETAVATEVSQSFVLHNLGLFAQDTWRATPRLNLTYGVRWDIDFVPTSKGGPGIGGVTGFSNTDLSDLALAPAGTPPYHTRYGNVAPRIGGAYRLSTDPNWGRVVRGGFGVFYGQASTEVFNEDYDYAYYPLGNLTASFNVPFPTPAAAAAVPPIVPPTLANGGVLFGLDPNLKTPYALEWNVAFEQTLGSAQTFKVSYVGAADRNLIASESITNPNPNYASAILIGNGGNSNFQSLQMQFQRHLTNRLQALVSYAWSHAIDTGSYGEYQNGSLGDLNANRADSDYDVRHLSSGAVTYSVPAYNRNLFTRALTGGWSTDDVVQLHSGSPVDVQDGNFLALNGVNSSIVIRPDSVPGQPQYLSGSQYPGRRAINPASFIDPPVDPATGNPLRQGNVSRNARRALGLTQWDFTLHRDIPIHEQVKLQFRAELFNLLNHPNFGPFNNQFLNGNVYFGQSTQMFNQYLGGGTSGTGAQNPLYTPGGPRSGELALKLIF
jgi:Carboxypeptidase regulatory-like domain/TonB dependent receptor-like, beta-barrel